MILFLAGTKDARELAENIFNEGYSIIATVVTEEAAQSYKEMSIPVTVGRKTVEEMAELINEKQIRLVIDSTHPYAEQASLNAIEAAKMAGVPYLRYERSSAKYKEHPNIHYVYSYEEAAIAAKKIKGTILLATGSKTLNIFTKHLSEDSHIRLIIRLLPIEENMQKCKELGIDKKNIIALQGPFTSELNRALFNAYNVDVLVTKETGEAGSMDEKVITALEMGITTIIISRPMIEYPLVCSTYNEIFDELNKIKN